MTQGAFMGTFKEKITLANACGIGNAKSGIIQDAVVLGEGDEAFARLLEYYPPPPPPIYIM
jgi:hypothetical protein